MVYTAKSAAAPADTLALATQQAQPEPMANIDEEALEGYYKTPEDIRKEKRRRTMLRVIISVAIIVVGIFLILLLISKAAQYPSIGSMLAHMSEELALMWQRITA